MSTSPEKPDNFVYGEVTLFPDSMRFFLAAAKYYNARLGKELAKIKSDNLFSELFDESEIDTLELSKEKKYFERIADIIEDKIENAPEAWDYELRLVHKNVRDLKALGLLYISNLEKRRDKLAQENSFSPISIQALDSKISRAKEVISLGIFRDASPWSLLIDEPEGMIPVGETPTKDTEVSGKRPPPVVLSSIGIIDQQLRERCLDLFGKFDEEEQHYRFDTVISEASRVLEARIRSLSGADSTLKGVKLMNFAFGDTNPKLIVSEDSSEQKAAHLMYLGFTGFIRNPFHHELIEDVHRERVLQILGWADHLIFLAQNATQNKDAST